MATDELDFINDNDVIQRLPKLTCGSGDASYVLSLQTAELKETQEYGNAIFFTFKVESASGDATNLPGTQATYPIFDLFSGPGQKRDTAKNKIVRLLASLRRSTTKEVTSDVIREIYSAANPGKGMKVVARVSNATFGKNNTPYCKVEFASYAEPVVVAAPAAKAQASASK